MIDDDLSDAYGEVLEFKYMDRPEWDVYALGVADAVAARGDCTRRQVGAVILDAGHRICGAGYNGSYSGGPSCLAGACPRGRHYQQPHTGYCACGNAWPCNAAAEPGSSYDNAVDPAGNCIAVHAELNCLLDVSDRSRLNGATMYVTCEPCQGCLKIIKNTKIEHIVWPEGSWIR